MSEMPPQSPTSPAPAAPCGGGVVFWLLVLMGLSTFAPCVILPEWRAYEALVIASQAEQHRVDALQRVVDREHRHLKALRSDQAVIDRLAQRELRFRRVGERAVRVSPPEEDDIRASLIGASSAADTLFVPEPVSPPTVIARLGSFLPDYDYEAVFCDDETRPIIMCMSVALICVAFGLFRPRETGVAGRPH